MTAQRLVLFDIDGTLLLGKGSGRAATERAMREVFGTVGALAEYRFAGKTDWYTLVELLTPEGFSEEHIAGILPHYSEVLVRHIHDVIDNYQVHVLHAALDLDNALAPLSDIMFVLSTVDV